MQCPMCQKTFNRTAPTASVPFCSKRCKLIDLSRWMSEDYVISEAAIADGGEDSVDVSNLPAGPTRDDNTLLH